MANPAPSRLHSLGDFAALATMLARSGGSIGAAFDLARAEGLSIRAQNVLRKSASLGVLTTEDGAVDDFTTIAAGFVESLASAGAFDRILAVARQLPLSRPGLRLSTAISGSTPDEAALKLVDDLAIAQGGLTRRKSTALVIATKELLRQSEGARVLIERELRQGLARAVDDRFVPELADAATAVPATGNVIADLGKLLTSLPLGAQSMPVFVLSPQRAAAVAVAAAAAGLTTAHYNGGTIFGASIAVTDALPTPGGGSPPDTIGALVVDADRVAAAAEGVTMRVVDGGTATVEGSEMELWARGCSAILAERWWGSQILSSDAVAALTEEMP